MQHNHWPCCKLQVNSAKMGQAEQVPDLPRSASNVLGPISSLFNRVGGKWKCRGKSTLGAACPTQKIMFYNLCCSGRTIKQELEHLVEVRPTRPVQTTFEIIDYFKCEISE